MHVVRYQRPEIPSRSPFAGPPSGSRSFALRVDPKPDDDVVGRPLLRSEEYHPYGSTSWHARDSAIEVSAKRYRYTGKEKDDETGLYYHGARHMAPWLGRWTACDPKVGGNRYRYCGNRPIVMHDPDGRAEVAPPSTDPEDISDMGVWAKHWTSVEERLTYAGERWEAATASTKSFLGSPIKSTFGAIDPGLGKLYGRELAATGSTLEAIGNTLPFVPDKLPSAGDIGSAGIAMSQVVAKDVGTFAAYGLGGPIMPMIDEYQVQASDKRAELRETSRAIQDRQESAVRGGALVVPTLAPLVAPEVAGGEAAVAGAGARAAAESESLVQRLALGRRGGLIDFRRARDAKIWADFFFDTAHALTDELLGTQLRGLMKDANEIVFNLDDVIPGDTTPGNFNSAIRAAAEKGRGANPDIKAGRVTEWELSQVIDNPELLKKTTFYVNGNAVSFQ